MLGEAWRGARFETDWQPRSPIRITAQIGARRSRDKGTVLAADPAARLDDEFLPRVSGLPDAPENQSRVTLTLTPVAGGHSHLGLTHTVPDSPIRRGKDFVIGPDSARKHVAFDWRATLPILKRLVETGEKPLLGLGQP